MKRAAGREIRGVWENGGWVRMYGHVGNVCEMTGKEGLRRLINR